MSDIDHTLTPEIVCPYCGFVFRDSWDYTWEDDEIKIECPICDREFKAQRTIETTYSTARIEK